MSSAAEPGAAAARPIRVLFVCLGNICRSPLAEGLFVHHAREAGLAHRFVVDSAGTSGYHIGDPPDERTAAVAARRGVELVSRARRMDEDDLRRFDYVIAMDAANRDLIRSMESAGAAAEVRLLREFDPEARTDLDVPDPYYGGPDGFEKVHDMVDRSCRALLDHLVRMHHLQ